MLHHHPLRTDHAKAFAAGEQASVAVSSALVLPALLGIAGLAIEYGDALVTRAETQRVADLAAHAGIVAYGRSADAESVTRAARNVAYLNGVSPEGTVVSFDASGAAGPVVRVTITTQRPLVLSQMVAARHSLDVTVRSAATIEQGQPACVQALDPMGSGVTLSDGTAITAADCAVASNAAVTASGGSSIVTEKLYHDSDTAPEITGGASLRTPDGGTAQIIRAATPDPFADHSAVALSQSRLAMVAAMPSAQRPIVATGQNIDFGSTPAVTQQQAAAVGCVADLSGKTWNFACPSGGVVHLGNLTIGGGLNLNFATDGPANTTFSFSGHVRNSGATMRFGPATYQMAGGFSSTGGTTTLFDAGTFQIGRASVPCDTVPGYSICNTATMTVQGPSRFELEGGVRTTDGATLTLGTGDDNSFRIGAAANGEALTVDGGAHLFLGDPTGADNKFELVGHTRTEGGSCLSIGAAANHDIAGHFDLSGGVTFGQGVYTIDGYLHLGAVAGGSVWCQDAMVSLRAIGASFVLSGKGLHSNNQNCNGYAAFCASSGYDSMRLVAPSSGPYADIAVIGPLSPTVTAGATFSGGAFGSQISGAFYVPNGPILLTGGAGASSAGEGCFQLVGASVTLEGGTSTTSDCVSGNAGGGAQVRLIE